MKNEGALILLSRESKVGSVEVVRSFAFKLNVGNYQSCDFFCSQKATCKPEDADEVSAGLYEWCFEEVMASVKKVQERQVRKEADLQKRSAA